MLPSILIVDDEQEILNSLKRLLRKHYQVFAYSKPQEALVFFKETPVPIVISDMKMPDMDGADFLHEIWKINHRCKRIALTGFADTELAQKAINQGYISQYLNKPWNNEELLKILANLINELKLENKKLSVVKKLKLDNEKLSFNQESVFVASDFMEDDYQHLKEERNKLQTMNKELLYLSTNLIATQTQDNNGHTFRIAQQARVLASHLGLSKKLANEIYIAGLYHRVGISSIEHSLINKKWHEMSQQERNLWQKYPQESSDVMSSTSFLSNSAKIVKHIHENVDGTGIPDHQAKDNIPIGARILSLLIYFDLLVSGYINGHSLSPNEAQILIKPLLGKTYDNNVFNAFVEILNSGNERFEKPVTIEQLAPGIIITQDIFDLNHHKLLAEKTELTERNIVALAHYQERAKEPLIVYIYNKHIKD